MSDSEGEILLAEEATPDDNPIPGADESNEHHTQHSLTSTNMNNNTASSQPREMSSAILSQRTDSMPSQARAASASGNPTPGSHAADSQPGGRGKRTAPAAAVSTSDSAVSQGVSNAEHSAETLTQSRSGLATISTTSSSHSPACVDNNKASTPSTPSQSAAGFSTSTPEPASTPTPAGAVGQRFPNQLTRELNRELIRERRPGPYSWGRGLGEEGDEEGEEEDWEELGAEGRMGTVASSILGYSPLVFDTNEEDGGDVQLEELYVPITGYEVMEQRAKFTVFKLHVQKSTEEGYFIFRRYTDFTRLNNKLKLLFPCFRLSLPPKRWFGNNFDAIFLEDRMLGLQAFLNNITGHKDVRKSGPVKEFLCLNDPPGPHDSLEESRVLVMVESLEEVAYNLRRDLADRDRLLRKKEQEIARLKARIQELENAGLPLEAERAGTDQESESSTVEGDRRSCVEADLMDHGIPDDGVSESGDNPLKVKIETLGKEPVKCGGVVGERDPVAMPINQPATLSGGDSR